MTKTYPWDNSARKAVYRFVNLRREIQRRRAQPPSKYELQKADHEAAESELVAVEAWLAARPGRELLDAFDANGYLP